MEVRMLGNSGLFVSYLTLGTMTWGRDTDAYEARDQFNIYYDAGGRSIDTADVYCDGASEEIVGEFLREYPDVVLATKAVAVPEPRKRDASRRQVRYIGISNYSGWQHSQIATMAANRIPIVASQMEYSLLERGIEREVVSACQAHNIGIAAWSPLGRGVLTGKYRHSTPADSRGASALFANFVAPFMADGSRRIVEALAVAAEGLGRPLLDTSLAWLLAQPQVSTAVVGARTAAQLRGIVNADLSELPAGIEQALSDVSAPPKGYPEYGWSQK